MDRRSFIASLIGGLAAASFASAGLAAQPQRALQPGDRRRPDDASKVDPEALDKTDADYAQYYYYGPRRRYWRRRYYGPRFHFYVGPRYYRPYPYYRPYGYRPYRRFYGGPDYYW
ncbi:hypothetical protein [Bosea sp. LjRoot237]|uniref:hypothetical protein n=1 Tax=Bosea sp. LjRoot237 TaxID=3342292 RepID=UPI003ECD0FA5